MNEAQVNRTQAVGEDAGDDSGVDVELLRRQRLNEFLRELVREEGRMETAELLGVSPIQPRITTSAPEVMAQTTIHAWRTRSLA